jgi:hypothetical protein
MADMDVLNYVRYVTGSGISNDHITLENQTINILRQGNHFDKYISNVDISYNIGADCYIVTISDDVCAVNMHKAIFWDNKYNFKFNVDKLEFIHEGRKVYISKE